MSREAMQMALEALESVTGHFTRTPSTLRDSEVRGEAHKAITVLRQALVDADDTSEKRVDEMVKTEHDRAVELAKAYERGWNAALAQQEPVAWLDAEMSQAYTIDELPDASGTGFLPLYTAPPKKQWVGLTDQEINSVCYNRDWTAPWTDLVFARAVEQALKEKNHG